MRQQGRAKRDGAIEGDGRAMDGSVSIAVSVATE